MIDSGASERLAVPRLHPRLRERRIAVRRDAGRRRLKIMLAGAGILGAFGGAYGLTRSPLFDLDAVRVEGAVRTDPAAAAAAGLLDGRPQLADVQPEASAARIEGLPWVLKATVTRQWPGTVTVSLLERIALAALPAPEGSWVLVDSTGRVLEQTAEVPAEMITLEAPQAPPAPGEQVAPAVRRAIAVVEQLPPTLQGRVSRLRLGEDDQLEVVLNDGPLVRFGPPDQVLAKLVALATLVERVDLRDAEALDVRVPTAPVLTRR